MDAAAGAGAISIHAAIEPQGIDDFGGDLFDGVVGGIEVADLVLAVERLDLTQLQTALAQGRVAAVFPASLTDRG